MKKRRNRVVVCVWNAWAVWIAATAATQTGMTGTVSSAEAAASDGTRSRGMAPPRHHPDRSCSVWSRRWQNAAAWAEREQVYVEDYNAAIVAATTTTSSSSSLCRRRLVVYPLDDRFDPPMGVFSHNHVQTGDKMSLPACFWRAIQQTGINEVPWLFAVRRIPGVTRPRVQYQHDAAQSADDEAPAPRNPTDDATDPDAPISECIPSARDLDTIVGGPLDFRAPTHCVFLPVWMMRALGLQPRDIVLVEQIVDVPAGVLAKLRPLSSEFAKDIANNNPQAVLETELRHYSSLTQGSTIAFDYNKKRYWFDVVELRSAPRGVKVPAIKVQDCDIATEFLTPKDVWMAQRKKKRQRLLEQKLERKRES